MKVCPKCYGLLWHRDYGAELRLKREAAVKLAAEREAQRRADKAATKAALKEGGDVKQAAADAQNIPTENEVDDVKGVEP
jgi:hypothetical protein